MKTIDEMLHLDLLTPLQHAQIHAWIAQSATPAEILQMPKGLWAALEQAGQAMGVHDDLQRPPALDAQGMALPG